MLEYAGDLLTEWEMLVETPAEQVWLDQEIWRLACALENTWATQVFAACDDAIPALPVPREHAYLEEIGRTAIARRMASRFQAAVSA